MTYVDQITPIAQAADAEVAQLTAELGSAPQQIADLQAQVSALQGQLATAQAALATEQSHDAQLTTELATETSLAQTEAATIQTDTGQLAIDAQQIAADAADEAQEGGPPPPPPPGKALLGASAGSGGIPGTVSQLGAQTLRLYEADGIVPADWSQSVGSHAPAGTRVVHSIRPSIQALAASDPGTISALVNAQSGRPDQDGEWEIMWHEPFNKGFTGAQWSAASVVYYTKVLPAVNAKRKHPIKYALCLQGSTIAAGSWSAFFTPEAMAASDSVGFDCYQLDQVVHGAAIAAQAGKPFSIAECGDATGVPHADAVLAPFMAQMISTIKGVANLAFACWYNGGTNAILDGSHPQCVADWKAFTLAGV